VINMTTCSCQVKDNEKTSREYNTCIVNDLIMRKLNNMEDKEKYQVTVDNKCIIKLQYRHEFCYYQLLLVKTINP
jgi:hypothetical protein